MADGVRDFGKKVQVEVFSGFFCAAQIIWGSKNLNEDSASNAVVHISSGTR